MVLKLSKKKYNSKIKIYYQDELNYGLAEEIIEGIWLNKGLKQSKVRCELIKDSIKGNVYRMEFDNCVYYLKSYAHRRFNKIFKNNFRPMEAVRYFKKGIKLMNADIEIAEPALGLTWRRNMFIVDSIFVTKEAPGLDLYTFLEKTNKCDKKLREKAIRKMALLWSKLINNNFHHQDPSFRNFMFFVKKEKVQIKFIDLDNIHLLPFLSSKTVLENLAKLRARQITYFDQTNTRALSQSEINIFFEEFIKNCHRKFNIDELQDTVNSRVIKRLIRFNKRDLIFKDNVLHQYL